MYVSTSQSIDTFATVVEHDEDDDNVNIHLDGLYLSLTRDEFNALVAAGAKAYGYDVNQHPFSGDTLVTIPSHKEAS
jgi:hypothetical protein